MSEHWKPSDLAVCVGPLDYDDGERGMFLGRTYTVARCFVAPLSGLPVLLFEEGCDPAPWSGWNPDCFRKVCHDQSEACESEFIALMDRIKRKVGA